MELNYFDNQWMSFPLNKLIHHVSFKQFDKGIIDGSVFVVPDAMTELVINLGSPYFRRKQGEREDLIHDSSHVIGIKKKSCQLRLSGTTTAVTIRFLPGALSAFSHENMKSLCDEVIDARLIFGNSITELENRLHESGSRLESLSYIESYLLSCVRDYNRYFLIAEHIQEFYRFPANTGLKSYISTPSEYKRLERLFNSHIGISPKKIKQIINFNFATKLLHERSERSLTQLALSLGYFDQAHFNKKFKEFSGTSPTSYLKHTNDIVLNNQAVINSMF